MQTFDAHLTADARLVILRELAAQSDGGLNSTMLSIVLNNYGHNRSRDWLHSQLNALAEIGAVQVSPLGTVLMARITRAGLDHVERRITLAGVASPSRAVD